MSDETLTQGSQAEANGSENAAHQEGTVPQTVPIERFNEVYADSAQTKRTLAEMQKALAESQATIAAMQTQRVAPAPQDVAPEMDAEDVQKINYHVNKAVSPLLEEVRRLTAAVTQTRNEPQISAVQAKLQAINNPAITARTNELIEMWRKDGRLGKMYVPEDALNVAAGQFALGQLQTDAVTQGQRRELNQFQPLTQAGGRQAGAGSAPRKAAQAREKDITEMTADEMKAFVDEQQKQNPDGLLF